MSGDTRARPGDSLGSSISYTDPRTQKRARSPWTLPLEDPGTLPLEDPGTLPLEAPRDTAPRGQGPRAETQRGAHAPRLSRSAAAG